MFRDAEGVEVVKIRKVVNRRFARRAGRSTVAGAVNAVVAANVKERGASHTRVSSRQRIVQRGGRTVVAEERSSEQSGPEGAR